MSKEKRERMVSEQLRRRDIVDPAVLAAFNAVPREQFVDAEAEPWAYEDSPLAIGFGQTISQPYVVAMTVQALDLKGHENVLEIGTGSGYAAAILGKLVRTVHTVERIAELAKTAAERLARLGFSNVHVRQGDGYLGWPEHAPYEAICVTASAPHVPKPLVDQLAPGGRMVIPVGDALLLVEKGEDGSVDEPRFVTPVAFVPLTGMAARG